MSARFAEVNANESRSITKEKLADEMSITLPDDHSNHRTVGAGEGSVMWHVPNPSGLGPRSGVSQRTAPEPEHAGPVTRNEAASRPTLGGAGAAGEGRSMLAQLASKLPASAKNDVTETTDDAEEVEAAAHLALGKDLLSLHGRGAATDQQKIDLAFQVVRMARALMAVEKDARRSRKDTPASDKTLQDYAKKCARIDAEVERLQDIWGHPIEVVMSRHAPHRQTFNAIKSALKRRALSTVAQLLKAQDALQRTGELGDQWERMIHDLRRATAEVDVISALDRITLLELTDREAVRSMSKRQQLKLLKAGWQDEFLLLNAGSQRYRYAGVLLRFCGLRPIELEKGVIVSVGDGCISVEIQGGKVREGHAGQPWRRFALSEGLLPRWFVEEVKREGTIGIEADPDDLRAHLHRLSDKLFPRRRKPGKRDVILSAYLFRHALVSELREAGWDAADIAGVIGEATAETIRWYGLRSRGGSLKPKSVGIQVGSLVTAVPVRPVDQTNLNAIVGSRGAPKKKATGF